MAESREEFAESTSSAFNNKKNRASNLIYIRKLTLCYLVQTSLLPAYVYIPLQRW